MLTHHIAAFLSVALASFTGQAHLYTLLLLSTELTTPFVNARWYFDQLVNWLPGSIILTTVAMSAQADAGSIYLTYSLPAYIPENALDNEVCFPCRGGGLPQFTQSMESASSPPGYWPESFCSSGFSSICGSIDQIFQI